VRVVRADDAALTDAVVLLAGECGRYGYRRITALLRADGWRVNAEHLFVERGPPGHVRSGNGSEFVAKVVRGWLARSG
jgi:hypothetical protein